MSTGLHAFYTGVLGLDDIPMDQFPRTEADATKGFAGKIRFATEGSMQMLPCTSTNEVINPVDLRGHIAFRTDDLPRFGQSSTHAAFYSDNGTGFRRSGTRSSSIPKAVIAALHEKVA